MDTARIQQVIETLLKELTVSFTRIDISHEGEHPMFIIRTQESGLLIGSNGDTLRALNSIVRRLVEKGEEAHGTPFIVDVNGYHSRRMRELKAQAKLLADRVRSYKSDVEMPPMNAYERMTVHALFTNDPEVFTESRGEGRERHIVIRYRDTHKKLLTSDTSLLAN